MQRRSIASTRYIYYSTPFVWGFDFPHHTGHPQGKLLREARPCVYVNG